MKLRDFFRFPLAIGFLATACGAQPSPGKLPGHVKSLDVYADDGRLHVLLATNTDGQENAGLYYTASEDNGTSWSSYTRIGTSCAPAYARGRGTDFQLAAKGGRIMAVWMQHGTGFMGRGPLSSAISEDGGKTWRNTGNPADDGSDGDHSFIDVTASKDGDFHAVWLDKRSGNAKGLYSSVYKVGKGKWQTNRCVDAVTCECCWNVVKSSQSGGLYTLYRDSSPRDMAWASSMDNGASWQKGGPAGNFQWDIQACVHVGGGLAIEERLKAPCLHAVIWTANQFNPGLYYLFLDTQEGKWQEPVPLADVDCTLPDIAVSKDGQVVATWIKRSAQGNQLYYSVRSKQSQAWDKPIHVPTGKLAPTHPKIACLDNTFHLFWSGPADNVETWQHQKIPPCPNRG